MEQTAIALWSCDYMELKDRFGELFDEADSVRAVQTPDETYVIISWHNISYLTDGRMTVFLKEIEKIRHAIVNINENGTIFTDVETDDSRGCDGEFEEILGWSARICVWGNEDDVIE